MFSIPLQISWKQACLGCSKQVLWRTPSICYWRTACSSCSITSRRIKWLERINLRHAYSFSSKQYESTWAWIVGTTQVWYLWLLLLLYLSCCSTYCHQSFRLRKLSSYILFIGINNSLEITIWASLCVGKYQYFISPEQQQDIADSPFAYLISSKDQFQIWSTSLLCP